jgi:hypothetical protein
VSHLGLAGRKTRLDEQLTVKLVALLSAGNRLATALRVAGVPPATVYGWLERGDPERSDPRDAAFRDFRERVERARLEGEARDVTRIAAAASRDWRAAAWIAERMAPQRWARRNSAGEPIYADPFARPGDDLGPAVG